MPPSKYEYIKQQVDVRLTRTTVEIFFAGTRIASHLRLHGRPNQYSTAEDHMPPDHQAYAGTVLPLAWLLIFCPKEKRILGEHSTAICDLLE